MLYARARGDLLPHLTPPPEAPGSSHSLLGSWPFAYAEKGSGAEAGTLGQPKAWI